MLKLSDLCVSWCKQSALKQLAVIAVIIFSTAANAAPYLPLFNDILFADDIEQIASRPNAYECSDLYGAEAYCLDRPSYYGIEDLTLVVYSQLTSTAVEMGSPKPLSIIKSVELSAPLTSFNYNSLLAGLRRDGYVFSYLEVNDQRLDVLAGLQNLDHKTLDEQMFTLANSTSYRAQRKYLMMDKTTFSRAYREGYRSMKQWRNVGEGGDPESEKDKLATLTIIDDTITVLFEYPFMKPAKP
ncbi:hypothetical protein L4D76_11650 [Photobacterium sagamiensis]|uniref:hypothetical protein n=1 Tax=Photobacterium sagamiensis TaxID=2910241 RepID=UPI003D0F8393